MVTENLNQTFLALVLDDKQSRGMVEMHESMSSTGSNSNEYQQNGGKIDDHPEGNLSREYTKPHDHPVKERTEENQPPSPCLEFTFTDFYAKPRLRWSSALHERFLQAVEELGGAFKATPMYILEKMGVPGLTIRHVKSHLQKHRNGLVPDPSTKMSDICKNGNEASSASESQSDSASSIMPPSMPKQKNLSKARKILLASEYPRAIYREKQMKYRMQRKLRRQQEMMNSYLGSFVQTIEKPSSDETGGHVNDVIPMLPYQTNIYNSSLVPAYFDPLASQNDMLPIELGCNTLSFSTGDYPSVLPTPMLASLDAQHAGLLSEQSVLMNVSFEEAWMLPEIPIVHEGVKENSSQMNEKAAACLEMMDCIPSQDAIIPDCLAADKLDLEHKENMVFPPHFQPQEVGYFPTEYAAITGCMKSETNAQIDDHFSAQNSFLLSGIFSPQQDEHITYVPEEATSTRDNIDHEQVDSEMFYNNCVPSGGIEALSSYLQDNM